MSASDYVNNLSITGYADSHYLVFTPINSNWTKWNAIVPIDMDGMYVCIFTAIILTTGETSQWSGLLYITNGKLVWVYMSSTDYNVTILPDRSYNLSLAPDTYEVILLSSPKCINV